MKWKFWRKTPVPDKVTATDDWYAKFGGFVGQESVTTTAPDIPFQPTISTVETTFVLTNPPLQVFIGNSLTPAPGRLKPGDFAVPHSMVLQDGPFYEDIEAFQKSAMAWQEAQDLQRLSKTPDQWVKDNYDRERLLRYGSPPGDYKASDVPDATPAKRRPGRPLGSKNKPKGGEPPAP